MSIRKKLKKRREILDSVNSAYRDSRVGNLHSIFGEPTVVIRVPSSILDQLEDYLVYYAESDAERRKYMRFHLVAAPEAYYQELYSNNLKK